MKPRRVAMMLSTVLLAWAVSDGSARGANSFGAADGAPANAVYVYNDGRVGIGTTSPQQWLSVNGALNVDQADANRGSLHPGITFGSRSGEGIASNRAQGENYGGLDFYTCKTKRICITWDGNIGIGTTSPDVKMTLQGRADAADYLLSIGGSNNGRMKVRHIDGKDWLSNSIDSLYLQDGINKHTILNANGSTGNVGIGIANPQAKLDVLERIRISDSGGSTLVELGRGLDYAEGFDVSDATKTEAGAVLVIDPANPGKLKLSDSAYDKKVAGIAAGAKGLGSAVRLGVGQFDCDVALAGRVYCNADATTDAIEPGDLLTTSHVPGHAMKAAEPERAIGAVLGKAMEPLEKGKKGQILVLVTLQ